MPPRESRSPPPGGVDRNKDAVTRVTKAVKSPPTRGRGSKHVLCACQRAGFAVAPIRGRGSKLGAELGTGDPVQVAPPHGGVDRNLFTRYGVDGLLRSPPTRGRGSKPVRRAEHRGRASRPPHGGVDRNLQGVERRRRPARSPPHTGAWIETGGSRSSSAVTVVAPHTGAWIETPPPVRPWRSHWVAPHTGAWIETGSHRPRQPTRRGRPPHTGAWIELGGAVSRPAGRRRRPPRGGVDRNTQPARAIAPVLVAPPTRGRGSKPRELAAGHRRGRSPPTWGVDRNTASHLLP